MSTTAQTGKRRITPGSGVAQIAHRARVAARALAPLQFSADSRNEILEATGKSDRSESRKNPCCKRRGLPGGGNKRESGQDVVRNVRAAARHRARHRSDGRASS